MTIDKITIVLDESEDARMTLTKMEAILSDGEADMNASVPQEIYTLRVKYFEGYYSVTCDQVPGLFLGGQNLRDILEDCRRSADLLIRLNKAHPI